MRAACSSHQKCACLCICSRRPARRTHPSSRASPRTSCSNLSASQNRCVPILGVRIAVFRFSESIFSIRTRSQIRGALLVLSCRCRRAVWGMILFGQFWPRSAVRARSEHERLRKPGAVRLTSAHAPTSKCTRLRARSRSRRDPQQSKVKRTASLRVVIWPKSTARFKARWAARTRTSRFKDIHDILGGLLFAGLARHLPLVQVSRVLQHLAQVGASGGQSVHVREARLSRAQRAFNTGRSRYLHACTGHCVCRPRGRCAVPTNNGSHDMNKLN